MLHGTSAFLPLTLPKGMGTREWKTGVAEGPGD